MNIEQINPELQKTYKRLPNARLDWRLVLWLARWLGGRQKPLAEAEGVTIEDRQLDSAGVRIYSLRGEKSGAGMLWIHGGGLILGSNIMNDRECIYWARELGVVVVSVEYGLAPEHPFPEGLDDCLEAWDWLQSNAEDLGIDPNRVVVSGQSAGGCLSAALTQRLHDRGGVQPVGQALLCPMLDDRTAARRELDGLKHKLWNNQSNRAAWGHYLQHPAGEDENRDYAVPARRGDLSGLPEAWIGIGDVDLFYEEAGNYRDGLERAGVACEFHTAPGGYHGFEGVEPEAQVSRDYMASNERFLRRILKL